MKVKIELYGEFKHVQFKCPGCLHYHILPIEGPKAWGFNNDLDKPTLTPSILYSATYNVETQKIEKIVCHSFLRDGVMEFLGDCTHSKKSTKMLLPELLNGEL